MQVIETIIGVTLLTALGLVLIPMTVDLIINVLPHPSKYFGTWGEFKKHITPRYLAHKEPMKHKTVGFHYTNRSNT